MKLAGVVSRYVSPLDIIRLMTEQYGGQWLEWEPETLWQELRDDLGWSFSRRAKDKIMAARTMIKSNAPWEQWPAFLAVAQAINDTSISPEAPAMLSPAELAYAVRVMNRYDDSPEWSWEVRFTIAGMLANEGIVWMPPEPLGEIVNDVLEQVLSYRTQDCVSLILEAIQAYEGMPVPEDSIAGIHTTKLRAVDEYIRQRVAAESNPEPDIMPEEAEVDYDV